MKYSSKCPHCGHAVTAYTQPMNAGLARAFLKLADAQIRLGRVVKKHELVLDHSQYGNFQKLRHFGFVNLIDGEGWQLTGLGTNWLMGQVTVLSPCGYMGNETLEPDHLAWSTHKGKRVPVSLRDVLPQEWKEREDFRAERRAALSA